MHNFIRDIICDQPILNPWFSSWYDIELKLAAHTYVYPPLLPFKRLLKRAIVRIEFAILVIIFSWKCVYLGGLYSDSVNRALAPYLLTSINFTDHLFWPQSQKRISPSLAAESRIKFYSFFLSPKGCVCSPYGKTLATCYWENSVLIVSC